ncbi:hypothetical protein [Catenuloplanes atrovinosus]|uniref:Uncharacterized protein n=1 Tax=Catenuloplanes atrovinosus TaxID=137266 RepID=A0AAE3YR88_9ACTN|nr:hypothetical protein [Catenuloplanes atrovinosus]MDR7278150.1 hypothetical protein [Catenuloplanes atrovinosus]
MVSAAFAIVVAPSAALFAAVGGALSARVMSARAVRVAGLARFVSIPFVVLLRGVLTAFAVFPAGTAVAVFAAGTAFAVALREAAVAAGAFGGAAFADGAADPVAFAAAFLPAAAFPSAAAFAPAVVFAVLFFVRAPGVAAPGPRFGELTVPVAAGPAGFAAVPVRARFPGAAAEAPAALPARPDTLRPVPVWSPVVTSFAMSTRLTMAPPA